MVIGAASLIVQGNFEGFLLFTLLGGVVIAILLFAANAQHRPNATLPDPFASDRLSTDTLNFAHIRVTGVGGLGLVLVSTVVAFQFQLVLATLVAGLIGGIMVAWLLILHRRRRKTA
jgi:membrane protein DedA with SNARE-associated domain